MRRIFLIGIITALLCTILHFCHPWADTYSYYCPEIDFSFQIREESGSSVLILNGTDTLYYPPLKGQYLGMTFYVLDSCNSIYFLHQYDSVWSRKNIQNKYEIKYLQRDKRFNLDLTPLGDSYWEFCGGCDQGHHTFSYSYKGMNYKWHLLEPLEWK